MNFNPNFDNPVVVNPPIVQRRVRDVHRTFITEQPHILEDETRIFNHHILRHTCCVRPICNEFNCFQEQNCCNIPGIVGPGCGGPIGPGCGGPNRPGFGGPGRPGFGGPGGPGFGPGGPRPR